MAPEKFSPLEFYLEARGRSITYLQTNLNGENFHKKKKANLKNLSVFFSMHYRNATFTNIEHLDQSHNKLYSTYENVPRENHDDNLERKKSNHAWFLLITIKQPKTQKGCRSSH